MKFWHPIPMRITALCREIEAIQPKVVVDVGGNDSFRLPCASHVIGWEGDLKLDVCRDHIPFEDQEVDFLFCRHTIEDLSDPAFLLSEIRRVAKRGYLETPSALCEITRGVDAAGPHMGYSHHRWLCYERQGAYRCLAKYPVIEHLDRFTTIPQLADQYDAWNFGYRFEGPLEYRVLQNEDGFRLSEYDSTLSYPAEYFGLVLKAAGQSGVPQ